MKHLKYLRLVCLRINSTKRNAGLPIIQFGSLAALGVMLISLRAPVAEAVTRNWNDGSGNWNTAGNWSPAGVPVAGDDVRALFADGTVRTIAYDYTGAAVTLNSLQINLDGSPTANTTLSIAANSLTTTGEDIGTTGRGTVTQSGGAHTVGAGNLRLASASSASHGTYNLSGTGSLTVNGYEYVGASGQATFNQSGGTHTIAGSDKFLDLGLSATSTGVYNLSGGTLTAPAEYIGDLGGGGFNQTGGTNTINNGAGLTLGFGGGSGSYSLNGGTLNSNGTIYVGKNSTGQVDQTGGLITTNVASVSGAPPALIVGNVGASGFYYLSGTGTLNLDGPVEVRTFGRIDQVGGNLTTTQLNLGTVGAGGASYHLGGGGLTISAGGDLIVGNTSSGTFSQTGGAVNVASGSMFVGAFNNVVGSYTQTGGTFTHADGAFNVGYNGGTGTFDLSAGSDRVGEVQVGSFSTGALNVSGTGEFTANNLHAYKPGPSGSGGTINFSGGRINTLALTLESGQSQLNWTGGTLNITTDTTFDSNLAVGYTGGAFGGSLSLGANKTLMVTGNEGLGGTGAFTLTLNNGSAHYVTGTVTLNATGTITQNAGSALYAATFIHGGGTVNGTLQNQGNFVYASGLFNGRLWNQGTVSLGPAFTAGNGVQNDSTITLTAGQTLTANGAGIDNRGTLTLAGGTLSGTSGVTNNYGGTMQAHGTINPTFQNYGVLNVDGILRFNNTATNLGIIRGSGSVFGTSTNAAGGTIEVSSGSLLSIVPTIVDSWANAGLVTLTGGVLAGGVISNTGTMQGAGTINSRLVNAGVVRATGGQLILGADNNSNNASGLIQAETGSTVMMLQGLAANTGTIGLTGGQFDNNNRPLSNSAIISGHGALRTGGLTNTTTGAINVGGGDMDIFGSLTNNGAVVIQSSRSLNFYGNVSGAGSYGGAGSAVFLAGFSPGNSPATVTFGGNVALASTLNIELGGTGPGDQFDQLLVNGALSLGGTLNVSLINGFIPAADQSFNILDWGSLSGSFNAIQLPSLAGGLQWNTSQLYTTGVLSVVSPGLAGDYNHNGVVDAADYVTWRKGLGTTYTQADYNVWRAHFGQPGSGAASGNTANAVAVPEPMALLPMIFAAACWCLRRGPNA